MADGTGIQWTDATWSIVAGCDHVSPGCGNCYAARLTSGRLKRLPAYAGLAVDGRFTGEVRPRPDLLRQPLTWRKPRRIFVSGMADLFHESVPDEFIAQAFAVMAQTPQHTYQVLTKRHGRMRSLLTDLCRCGVGHPPSTHFRSTMAWASTSHSPTYVPGLDGSNVHQAWPLPNVWLGVSCENQRWADIRIPALLDTPAAVRFISAEPLLGPIDLLGPLDEHGGRPRLSYWLDGRPGVGPAEATSTGLEMRPLAVGPRLDWVISGGESGPGARLASPDWFRSLRDQCQAAGVAYFHKQNGQKRDGRELDGREWSEYPAGGMR